MSGFEIELPSSPDPLGDESIVIPPGSVAPPPPSTTRRSFQSAASSRFSAIPGTSPRKRMFALDVGNEITPQTIYVTVEAGPDGNPITRPGGAGVGGANVRRLLFGSPTPQPSPRRAARTTTTTVPLRGLTDDEGDPTPRRRRRSSTRPGTPATAGAKRKKKGTPTPKAARKPRGTPVASSDALQSEAPATIEKPTPAKKRGRPPKRKAETAPSDQDSHAPPEASTAKKPGRKRQKSIQADDTDELTTTGIDVAPLQSHDGHPSQNTDDTNQHLSLEEATEDGGTAYQDEGDEEDPFLAQLSDPTRDGHPSSTAERTTEQFEPSDEARFEQQHSQLEDQGPLPGESDDYAPMMDFDDRSDVDSHHGGPALFNAQAEHGTLELEDQGPLPGESDDYAPMMDRDDESDAQSRHSETTPRVSRHIRHDPVELEDQGPLPGDSDGYAPMMDIDDRSDAESRRSFQPPRSEDATDNIVDPDTFTMIGIETMPCFQGNRGAPTSDLPEIGETTSLLINKTLESLRQEMDVTDEENDDVDLLGSREQTPAVAEPDRAHNISSGRKQSSPRRSQTPQSRRRQSSESPLQPPRARLPLEHAAPEPPQKNTQSSAQRRRAQDNNNIVEMSSDELNADDDSFSDIPEEVFAAAEPQDIPQPERSPSQDELSMAVVPAQDSAPDADRSQEITPSDSQNSDVAESPKSPAEQLGRNQVGDGNFVQRSASRSIQSRTQPSLATQQSSPPHPNRSRSDSNRLLTPPDEPTSSSNQSIPATNQPHEEQSAFVDQDDEIGSSPPEITTFDREDEQPVQDSRRSSDTPANRPPSIHLQPAQPREANAAIFPSQSAGPRPFLSPIVRVGERLQNILSDPPSPSARSSVLGSPFKGSVRKSSLDAPSDEEAMHRDTSSNTTLQNPPAAPESPKSTWAQSIFSLSHLKSLVTEGTKRITSPQVNVTQTWEDPFGPSSPTKDRGGSARNSAFMERIRQASREGSVHSSKASVARATLGDVDDRSLSGDPAPRALSSNWRGERSQKPALLGSEAFPGQGRVGYGNGYDGAADKRPETADRLPEEPRTDDTLLQPAEDQAPEAESIRYPQFHKELFQEAEIQTRSKEDAMQVDEEPLDGDGSDDEDVWAIEADRTASSPTAQKRANESINESFNAFGRSGLSIDWGTRSTISQTLPPGRSPAFKQSMRGGHQDVPENLEDYSLLDLHSGTSTQPSAKKPTPEQQRQPKRVDLSDFFSSSPNFIEREQRARTALKARSMAQNSAESDAAQMTLTETQHDAQDEQFAPQRQTSSDSRLSDEMLSPDPVANEPLGHLSSESTPTPERPRLPQQRLASRPSQNDAALFETWEVSSSRAPTERLHLSDPISDAQPSSPQAIERPSTPVDREESSFEAPTLKPLPGRTMSPSKSCLRSPLKPKTPGRVVEFTSSTLSPMAQGQARAGSQGSKPTTLGRPPSLSPRRSPRGKENQPSALKSYIRSSPRHKHLVSGHHQQQQQQQQEEPADSPLSQTKWTKRHWLLMDDLLQAYRRNALDFQLRHSDAVMASPRKRASSSLLGKIVTSQGERMALEQWHLDVVDAFKREVGGWPEDALAKRLFSLIVGEERRRVGLVPKRR